MHNKKDAPQPPDPQHGEANLNRIHHIAEVAFNTIGWSGRTADFAVIVMMTVDSHDEHGNLDEPDVIEEVVHYCWDHLLGEPAEPTEEELTDAIKKALAFESGQITMVGGTGIIKLHPDDIRAEYFTMAGPPDPIMEKVETLVFTDRIEINLLKLSTWPEIKHVLDAISECVTRPVHFVLSLHSTSGDVAKVACTLEPNKPATESRTGEAL